jgi:zinc/manganese transport system substrate-binding protein
MFGNPHYWLDPHNGLIMARAIAQKLSQLDPTHKAIFEGNLSAFSLKLEEQMKNWDSALLPFKGQELIGYHNEWVYLIKYAGLEMLSFLEPKPGIPPTPKQLEFLVGYMSQRNIKGIIQATYYPTEAGENVVGRTNARLLLLCQNVGEVTECSDYIAMLDFNISKMISALSGKGS